MSGHNDARRVAFAAIAIPLALLVVWWGGWPLTAVVAIVAVLGVRELYAFAVLQGVRPLVLTGEATALALPFLVLYALRDEPVLGVDAPYWAALWLLLVLLVALARRAPTERPLAATAVTVFGVAYAAALPCFLLALRHLPNYPTRDWSGTWLVFTPLVVIWVGDTVAMFGGRAIGGPKLAPRVSPGKTWAGTICGLLASMATVPLLNVVVLGRLGLAFPFGRALLFGAALSIVGQAGDLVESLLKREVGLKDSSALIPGHGGVLDRLDSLYFALPVAAALYRLFEIA